MAYIDSPEFLLTLKVLNQLLIPSRELQVHGRFDKKKRCLLFLLIRVLLFIFFFPGYWDMDIQAMPGTSWNHRTMPLWLKSNLENLELYHFPPIIGFLKEGGGFKGGTGNPTFL